MLGSSGIGKLPVRRRRSIVDREVRRTCATSLMKSTSFVKLNGWRFPSSTLIALLGVFSSTYWSCSSTVYASGTLTPTSTSSWSSDSTNWSGC